MTGQTDSLPTAPDGRQWQLQLAYHPSMARVGTRATLTQQLALGRSCSVFGSGVFDDVGVSREHAQLQLSAGQQLLLEDRGSRNGSFVNGVRVESTRLRHGDILGTGRLQFLVLHEVPRPELTPPGLVADSAALRSAWASACTGLQRGNVLLWGPRGGGKRAFALAVAATLERPSASLEEVLGSDAPHGSWVLTGVAELDSSDQKRLYDRARNHSGRVITVINGPTEDYRARITPELFSMLAGWPVHIPPIAQRRADIMPLVLHLLRRYGGEDCEPTAELAFALLRQPWQGNVAELESIVERAVIEAQDGARVGVFADLRHLLNSAPSARDASRSASRTAREAFQIARNGTSFRVPNSDAVDISRREVLARMLAVFVENRERWPGRVITVPELVLRCWPGERMKTEAGSNRVYVALATLRKLGLRDILLRDDAGYLLDPDVPLVFD